MARYKLKEECCFVDAQDHDTKAKKPDTYPFPHVFNQTKKTYVAFNEPAAFIARFIVLGVDTGVIPQILVSEYGGVIADPALEVGMVIGLMSDYLQYRDEHKPYAPPGHYQPAPAEQLPDKHTGKLKLDFSTNPVGIINLKTPTS